MCTKPGADAKIASAGAAYWWKVQTELGMQWRAVAVPRLTEGSAWLIGDRPCLPAKPCRGRPIGAVRALTLRGPVGAAVRLMIPRTHTIFANESSYLTLTPQVMIYFTMLYFYAYAQLYRLGRKHYVFGLSVHLCVCAYVQTEAFSDRLAVDFHSCN